MQTDSIEDHKSDSNLQSKDKFLFAARLIPMGREGNKVFARTLRPRGRRHWRDHQA